MCTFLPPGGVPPGGPKSAPREAPQKGGSVVQLDHLLTPKWPQKWAQNGGPGGGPGRPPGRPGPGPARAPPGARGGRGRPPGEPPAGGSRRGSRRGPRTGFRRPSDDPIITVPTGDALRSAIAQCIGHCPKHSVTCREGPRHVTHLFGDPDWRLHSSVPARVMTRTCSRSRRSATTAWRTLRAATAISANRSGPPAARWARRVWIPKHTIA